MMGALAIAAITVTSCKKEGSDSENSSNDTTATIEADTTATSESVQTVNDSNASGTTSGEMEQVP